MYTLDTNAIIYFIKDDSSTVSTLNDIFSKYTSVYISSITEVELFSFPSITSQEGQRIEKFLSIVSIIPLNSQLARIAGAIRKTYHLKIADSIIAATAMFTGSTLVTRNVKDFNKIPNLLLRDI